jgi:hypothetical protein
MLYDITTNIDYECSICLESINIDDFILYDEFINNYNDISSLSSIKTHCGHFFHSKCLYLNNLKYSTCPICRQSFTYNNITDNSNNININITDYSDNSDNININITDYSDIYSQYFFIKFKISSYRTCYIYIHKGYLISIIIAIVIIIIIILIII